MKGVVFRLGVWCKSNTEGMSGRVQPWTMVILLLTNQLELIGKP